MVAITVSSKYQIVIPREVRETLKITPGTRLLVTQDLDGLRLVKEPSLQEIRGLLKGMKVMDEEIRDETSRELP
ncbi:MAG: AbrB/MazE/SpoVT family DNA-binding domain-containing protein [Verrucomicrobiota bacterium]